MFLFAAAAAPDRDQVSNWRIFIDLPSSALPALAVDPTWRWVVRQQQHQNSQRLGFHLISISQTVLG